MARWPLPEPMQRALALAQEAADAGEVPVGAVVMHGAQRVGEGRNRTRSGSDPTAHAEIIAIRDAARRLGRDRLGGCSLWVTLEPCAMCAGAISHARISALYYAAPDPKGGGVDHGARVFAHPQTMHRPDIYRGIGETEGSALLKAFFEQLR
ncbi:MAG: nucleoside deaminase [Parerythrobacter sp.]